MIPSFRRNRYWDNKDNQREFLDNLGAHLGFKNVENWYHLTKKAVKQNGGGGLLKKFKDSPSKLVISAYNMIQWKRSEFKTPIAKSEAKFWTQRENQRDFLDILGSKLGFKCMNDWYSLLSKQLIQNGGKYLLNKYRGSPSKVVMNVYEHFQWEKSNFKNRILGKKHWCNENNRIALVMKLEESLKIKDMSEWYRVSYSQIAEHSKHTNVIQQYSLEKLLKEAYPNHKWNTAALKQRKNSKASQRWLRVLIQQLFPKSG
jgi:hypothetical protein